MQIESIAIEVCVKTEDWPAINRMALSLFWHVGDAFKAHQKDPHIMFYPIHPDNMSRLIRKAWSGKRKR
jgi:hypothetical protein